jgi:hypothetical protein
MPLKAAHSDVGGSPGDSHISGTRAGEPTGQVNGSKFGSPVFSNFDVASPINEGRAMSLIENPKPTTASFANDLDRPIFGAEPIGREANLVDKDGNVDLRKTYYALERGYLDANKFGRTWVSTPRRIRRQFAGE